jgi:hypothetical protein
MEGAVRAQPEVPWSVESTHDGFRHVRPESPDTEARSSAVLSRRGDHHAANSFPPAAASRRDPAHDTAGTTVRNASVANESGTVSPLAEIATDEAADCAERVASHVTGALPPHASVVAAKTISAGLIRGHGIHENSRAD